MVATAKKTPTKGKDDRREKFRELGQKRTVQVIKYLKLIGNLSDRSNYIYEDAEVRKMLSAIEGALKETKTRFQNASDNKKSDIFSWD
jgi:hypothetical protein